MSETKRYKFKCHNCDRIYRLTRDPQGKTRLIIECPFCGAEAVVELAPFVTRVDHTLRMDTPQDAETLVLPDVIPTAPYTADEEE